MVTENNEVVIKFTQMLCRVPRVAATFWEVPRNRVEIWCEIWCETILHHWMEVSSSRCSHKLSKPFEYVRIQDAFLNTARVWLSGREPDRQTSCTLLTWSSLPRQVLPKHLGMCSTCHMDLSENGVPSKLNACLIFKKTLRNKRDWFGRGFWKLLSHTLYQLPPSQIWASHERRHLSARFSRHWPGSKNFVLDSYLCTSDEENHRPLTRCPLPRGWSRHG